ncbi:MAG TPA: Maf family protein [Bauldia sp.]|nr:Maf family protein [Bauldia sp.]
MARIILASTSPTRIKLLKDSGIPFEAMPPRIDERLVEKPLREAGRPAGEIALALAEAKASGIGRADRSAFVIGADQMLECDGRLWIKPSSLDEARQQLVTLAARTHELHTAVAGVKNGTVIWRHLDSARMTMRPLSLAFIRGYLEKVGEDALKSVGAYQVEGPGIQLFESIEGDYFTILGLPLLPLLKWLRDEGAIAS